MDFRPAVITGLRVEEAEKGVTYEDGASVVLAGTPVRLNHIVPCSHLLFSLFDY